jgi:hypothetical protein
MPSQSGNYRRLKKLIRALLLRESLDKALAGITALPPRQSVNPLFSFLCSLDEELRWRSISAMGAVVASLADTNLESARIVMRRFIWNLNDESGGIGWGCPEAMGEIMARHDTMAREYACILLSYLQPQGNYLEHENLQEGVLWGIGRLADSRPETVRGNESYLLPHLRSQRPMHRALAAYALGGCSRPETIPPLRALFEDLATVRIYRDQRMVACTISDLAREAVSRLESRNPDRTLHTSD